jgi:hypothetical protein
MNITRRGPELNREYSRRLTTNLRKAIDAGDVSYIVRKTVRLYHGGGDVKLGYKNWETYCAIEFQNAHFPLQDGELLASMLAGMVKLGMTRRAAGQILHVHEKQVRKLIPQSADTNDGLPRATAPAGRNLLRTEELLRRFIAEVQTASPEYADAGRQYWTEHLFKIEALIADAWPLVTGASSAELDALLEQLQRGD